MKQDKSELKPVNKSPVYLSTFFKFKDEIKKDMRNRDYLLIGILIIDIVIIVSLIILI